jgi:hypothetical protein
MAESKKCGGGMVSGSMKPAVATLEANYGKDRADAIVATVGDEPSGKGNATCE